MCPDVFLSLKVTSPSPFSENYKYATLFREGHHTKRDFSALHAPVSQSAIRSSGIMTVKVGIIRH